MSSSSDSEEFFDAEDLTPSRNASVISKRKATSNDSASIVRTGSEPIISSTLKSSSYLSLENSNDDKEQMQSDSLHKALDPTVGRKRFRELRQKMQIDDEDGTAGNASPPDSQTSSVEGVYAASNRTSHPFRIIEHDALSLQSMNSLGRVGRILGAARDIQSTGASLSTLSTSSKDSESTPSSKETSQHPSTVALSVKTQSVESLEQVSSQEKSTRVPLLLPLQEPDVIASTKSSIIIQNTSVDQIVKSNCSEGQLGPVAPPRRKKKNKVPAQPPMLKPPSTDEEPINSPLASPASTIESLTREFEHSLDYELPHKSKLNSIEERSKSENSSKSSTIKSGASRELDFSLDIRDATKGQYVVKPQDEDKSKAEGPTKEEVERIEKLKSELLSNNKTGNQRGSTSGSSIGRSSLGPHHRNLKSGHNRGSKERRRSAGDESMIKQLNMFVRTRTDSGKKLSDLEILEQVTVLNLDTGERVPLSIAEDKIPQCINPLSLQIMRLTSEYVSTTTIDKEKESDEESIDSKKSSLPMGEDTDVDVSRVRKRTQKLKRFLGSTVKKTMDKAKSIAQEVSHARHKEDVFDIVDEVNPGEQNIKLKAASSHKGPYDMENIQHVQELCGEHQGAIWCMKFSCCGRLLATAGQDKVLRVWVVRDAFQFFQDMRTKYNAEKVSPTPSQESLMSHHSSEDPNLISLETIRLEEGKKSIFMPKPFCTYTGHTSDLLDVAWSKNYFLLSSSMDKTVRLWHISRKECLCCFQHIDFVTAIVFHPRDDRYFLSGSLDGKLRLWNIPDKKVAVWNEVDGQTKLITAANFCQNGKFAVVGTYDGRCIFYNTDQLKYHTQIHVRSTRGKNSTGRKISGIEPMPGEDKILVTSNDSRIRLYDLCDLNLSCKYKGYVNVSSQIKASFSHDGKYIVSGSENRDIYVWKTHHDYSKFSSVRRDRNDFWEAIKAHNAVVTCAVFAPYPDSIIKMVDDQTHSPNSQGQSVADSNNKVEDPMVEQRTKGCGGHVLVSADFSGCIKVFINKMKPKHSSLPASALA